MGLYERLLKLETPAIPIHEFFATMQEYMLGNVTGGEATAAFNLSAGEQTEALALRDRILLESSNNANLQRRLKAIELENVLIVARSAIGPYADPGTRVATVKARLGVT